MKIVESCHSVVLVIAPLRKKEKKVAKRKVREITYENLQSEQL